METITVKEIKDDAIINVQVNKHYYAMTRALIYNLFMLLKEKGTPEDNIKNILNKKYEELDALEQSFYTVTLLIAEIERQAKENDMLEEKVINKEDIENNLKNQESKD
jgi:hypothetical protein